MAGASLQPVSLATPRGKLTLAVLCVVGFLALVAVSLPNVALPTIQRDLDLSVQSLQWILSAYFLTLGGFMLLGGRATDQFGHRRVLVGGITIFATSSLVAGLAPNSAGLIGAALAQGLGGALMLPAALSTLTTTFVADTDQRRALGAWGVVVGFGSLGPVLGGLLVQGPGWRWVFLAMPFVCVPVAAGTFWLVEDEPRHGGLAQLDLAGATLASTGALLLVYGLVQAPQHGWTSAHTVVALPAAFVLLAAFVLHERRTRTALLDLSILHIQGLGAADVTALIGFAGFIAPFFFVTLYMQEVLGYSPINSGLGFLPMAVGVVVSARLSSRIVGQLGVRPLLVAGSVTAAGGIAVLSRMPVHASYVADVLPGLAIMAVGLGALSVAATIAATARVPADKAGLAAALLNTSQQIGGALGLAIFSAIATSSTTHLLATGIGTPAALTSGFRQALVAASIFLLAAAALATRTARQTVGDPSVSGNGTNDPRDLEPTSPAPANP